MPDIYFKSVPFSKEDVTLALESGVDGIITEAEHVEGVRSLALCDVRAEADMPSVGLGSKAEEESIASRIAGGERLVLAQGWEIIPVENLLAQPAVAGKLAVEVASLAEARLAALKSGQNQALPGAQQQAPAQITDGDDDAINAAFAALKNQGQPAGEETSSY